MTDLGTRIRRKLLFSPFRTVAIDDQRSWRGIVMWMLVQHIARAIRERTDAPRVGVMLPTSGLFPAALLAAWSAGRTAVPLNYLLSPDDLDYVARDAGLDTIITVGPMIDFVGSGLRWMATRAMSPWSLL